MSATKERAQSHKLSWLENLYPGYFTLTMATGILSAALTAAQFHVLAKLFLELALGSWVLIFCLYTWRLILFPNAVLENLLNPQTTFIFFSFVAATDIVGMLSYDQGWQNLAVLCWAVAFCVWTLLLYSSFGVLTLQQADRRANVVHGGWLISIVGTQSLVLLGAKIAPYLGEYAHYMMLEVHLLWCLGLILYAIFVTLFCYRLFFLGMTPHDYSPLMWVIMGAAAISANAGSSLSLSPSTMPFLDSIHPMVNGIIMLCWSWATWWIPLLCLIGFWKHKVFKIPLRYEPTQWSIVFPLGMYTVATARLAETAEIDVLLWIANITLSLALFAWVLVLAALLYEIVKGLMSNV